MTRSLVRSVFLSTLLLSIDAVPADVPQTGADSPAPPADVMPLIERLPAEPLIAGAASGRSLAELVDGWVGYAERFEPSAREEIDAFFADASREAGCDLRADLLAHVGPRIAWVVDLPSIDSIAGAFAGADPATGLAHALGRVALLVEVDKADTVLACLGRVLGDEAEGVRVEKQEGLVRVLVPLGEEGAGAEGTPGPVMSLWYGAAGGLFAFGFDQAFVHGLLFPSPDRPVLTSGADFVDVIAHLDQKPSMLSYVNLPKVNRMLGESQVLSGLIAGNAEMRPLFEAILEPGVGAGGIGATSVQVDGGWRTTTFSRSSLVGSLGYSEAIFASIAVPNLLQAIDNGRQKRTTHTISDVAVAVDAYGEENGRFPVLGDDWQPVEKLAPALEGAYLEKLVTEDAWGHPLLYWSDGRHYRVISTGRDGKIDRDWRSVTEPVAIETPDGDIVCEERGFLAMPDMDDGD